MSRPLLARGSAAALLLLSTLVAASAPTLAAAAPAPSPAPTALPAAAASDALAWLLSAPPSAAAASDEAQLRQRAQDGNVDAQLAYARYLLHHDDSAQAVTWLTQANSQGDVRAQYLLGMLYLRGHGVAQDFEQARYFLGKAADQHYAPAQFQLGRLLVDAEFDDPSMDGAAPAQLQAAAQRGTQLLQAAADAGYAPARERLGR